MATSNSYKTESTWMQGVRAYRAGLPLHANPYLVIRHYHDEMDMDGWRNGWLFAREQERTPAQGE